VLRIPDLRPIYCTIPRRTLTVVAVVCAVAFAALAVYVWSSPHPTTIEGHINDAITSMHKDTAFRVFDAVSVIGSTGAVAVGGVTLAVFAWWWWRNLRLALVCVLGPALAGLGEIVIKEAIGRPRPLTASLSGESGFGFPSGHASGATALAVVLVLLAFAAFRRHHPMRPIVVVGVVLYAVVIGVSRLVVGAHFAFDVLGGALLGTTASLAVIVVLLPARATTSDVAQPANPPTEVTAEGPRRRGERAPG
jgi:membrane-associated phospholipid phosphatase